MEKYIFYLYLDEKLIYDFKFISNNRSCMMSHVIQNVITLSNFYFETLLYNKIQLVEKCPFSKTKQCGAASTNG